MVMKRTQGLYVSMMLFAVVMFLGGCGQTSDMANKKNDQYVVNITSNPSGATVFLNEKEIGQTPLDAPIEQSFGDFNAYSFRVEKVDYMPMFQVFKEQKYQEAVKDIIPPKMHFTLKERKKYQIHMTSDPSGASLTLNGQPIGITPFTAVVRERTGKPRELTFVAVKEGFQKKQSVLKEFLPKEDGTVFVFPESMHFDLK